MVIADRFTRGLIAGLAAGVVMNMLNYVSYYLMHFPKVRLLDFAAIYVLGHRPNHLVETIYAQVAQLLFCGLLGVLYALFISMVTSVNYRVKGVFISLSTWFLIYAMGKLFKVPTLGNTPWQTGVSNMVMVTVFGLVYVQIMHWLSDKVADQ